MVQVPTWLKSAAKQALPPSMQASLRAHYLKSSVLGSAKEEPEMRVIRLLVHPTNVVLDIGANIGRYTKLLSELVSHQGHVFAFEPIADNFKILNSVIKEGVLTNVTPMQVALDRQAGHQQMVIPDNSDFTGFYQAHFASQHDRGKREEVNVVSIDGLRRNDVFTRVHFIKCDAEGSELGILEGAVTTLQEDRPALFLEVQRKTSNEVFRLLLGLGYRAFVFDNQLSEVGEYRSEFWNYFFLGPDSLSQLDPQQLAVRR
jgi:FkbM family methyltransferase